MKAYLSVSAIGVFVYSDEGKLLEKELFPRNPSEAAQRILMFMEGKPIPELQKIYNKIKNNYSELSIESEENFGLQAFLEAPNTAGILCRKNLETLAGENGFHSFKSYLHALNSEITKKMLRNALKKPEQVIMQVISAIDEADENLNVLSERMRAWNSIDFPEMNAVVKENSSYAKILSKINSRSDFREKLAELAKNTIGIEFEQNDFLALKNFAAAISSFYETKNFLEAHLSKLMQKNFPNLSDVAGAQLGARLIAHVGDSRRLAVMPSSTIQLLGAEKALFRHIKTHAKPPKYGIILHHNLLQNAPKKLRGKIARALAAKISIAIKSDVYGSEFIGEKIRKELEQKIQRILGKR